MEEGGARRGGGLNPGPDGGGADLISALPEDVLLQILVRLRCARAAAPPRAPALSPAGGAPYGPASPYSHYATSRSDRSCTRSPLQAAATGPGVPLFDICIVPIFSDSQDENARFRERVSSLLHAAASLSPAELRFAVRPDSDFFTRCYMDVKAPHFHRATSIDLHGLDLTFPSSPYRFHFRRATSIELSRLDRVYTDPRDIFPSLERLSLSTCNVDLTDLVLRCPRLRVLREADDPQYLDIIIRSSSLQEIDMESGTPFMFCIHIEAPALKKLALSFATGCGIRVYVSILAPLLEKVSWRCRYTTETVGLGRWNLFAVTLKPAESSPQGDLNRSGEDQLPHVHVLSLYSVAHLHFVTRGHAFGALALHLLGIRRICTATQSLKIVLWRSESEDKEACPVNCPCDEPRNWRSQSISLTNLENVEIKGFEGEDHEFDFLELIFRCATILKRLTVRPSDEVTTSNDWCTKIYDIFKAYPFVECNLDLSPGSTDSGAQA